MGTARALVAESGVCLENELVVAIHFRNCLIVFSKSFLLFISFDMVQKQLPLAIKNHYPVRRSCETAAPRLCVIPAIEFRKQKKNLPRVKLESRKVLAVARHCGQRSNDEAIKQ